MSRRSTKARRAARRRNAVLRPLERRARLRHRYHHLTATEVHRRWAELEARWHADFALPLARFQAHFLDPLVDHVMRRYFLLYPPGGPVLPQNVITRIDV